MKKETAVLLCLALLKFALPFLLSNPAFELQRDEYLYYEQGQHLSLGYLENPPLIAIMSYISSLFGGGYFSIRIWPSVFGMATLWLTVKMVAEYGGGFYAKFIAAMGIVFCAYLRINFLFQPNFLDVFSWSLSAFYLLRYINSKQEKYIYLLAFALALGWYSKYSVLFFIIPMLLALALTKHRNIFMRRAFWLAFALALLLIAPNIIWQYLHHWPLAHHMQELRETQLQHLNRIDFLKEQLLMLLPVALVWLGGLVWLLKNKAYRVVAYCYLLIIILLMLASGKGYYALGAYPMLLAAGGVWAEKTSLQRTWLRYAFATIIILLAVPFVPILIPISSPEQMAVNNKKFHLEKLGILRWEDGKDHALQQDFADMLGWKKMTLKTEKAFNDVSKTDSGNTLAFCSNYGLAGAVKYFGKGPDFKSKIVSGNGSFMMWAPESLKFSNLVFVSEEKPKQYDELACKFQSATIVDSCTNPLSLQFGSVVILFKGASDSARFMLKHYMQERRAQFSR